MTGIFEAIFAALAIVLGAGATFLLAAFFVLVGKNLIGKVKEPRDPGA